MLLMHLVSNTPMANNDTDSSFELIRSQESSETTKDGYHARVSVFYYTQGDTN